MEKIEIGTTNYTVKIRSFTLIR